MEFETLVGCQRAKCSKYHVKIGQVVDSLPCAPGEPPKSLGPLPQHLKSHHVLKNNAEWTQEQKARFKTSYDEFEMKQCRKLAEFQQDFQHRTEMLAMEAVLAAAEERKLNYQVNRDHQIRGSPQLEIASYDRFPQLAFQPNLPPMEPRSSAMHQRPAPAPASQGNWPQEGPSCKQKEYVQEVHVKEEYDSDEESCNDSKATKKAMVQLRKKRKEFKVERLARRRLAEQLKPNPSRSPPRSSGSKQ